MKELQFYLTSLIVTVVRFILSHIPNALAKKLLASPLVHGGHATSQASITWNHDTWEGFGSINRRIAKIRIVQTATCEIKLLGYKTLFDVRACYLVHLEEGMLPGEIHAVIGQAFDQAFFKNDYSGWHASKDFYEEEQSIRRWLNRESHNMTSGAMSLVTSEKDDRFLIPI